MASIIDSFRETYEDRFAIFKIVVLAAPVYYAYAAFVNDDQQQFLWLGLIAVILLFGTLIKTASNVLNEADTILPSWNIFLILSSAFKGFLAVGPLTWLTIWLGLKFIPTIHIIPWLDTLFAWILWIVIAAVDLTSLLLFVKSEKISDSYNIKLISDKAGDLIVGVLFFIIQIVIVNIITTGFLGYTLLVLFGEGPLFYFFLAMAIVFNVCVSGHYLAQLQYEVIGHERNI